jgi:hypothetical protein
MMIIALLAAVSAPVNQLDTSEALINRPAERLTQAELLELLQEALHETGHFGGEIGVARAELIELLEEALLDDIYGRNLNEADRDALYEELLELLQEASGNGPSLLAKDDNSDVLKGRWAARDELGVDQWNGLVAPIECGAPSANAWFIGIGLALAWMVVLLSAKNELRISVALELEPGIEQDKGA